MSIVRSSGPSITTYTPIVKVQVLNSTIYEMGSNSAETAAEILGSLGPDAIGPLARASTNTDSLVRYTALKSLYRIAEPAFKNHNSDTSAETDAEAKVIVPIMINSLSDTDEMVRGMAAVSLGLLAREPDVAVPALIHMLLDTDVTVCAKAAESLGEFGTNAEPAVPTLIQLVTNRDGWIRHNATNALKAIDPAAAAKAGVK